MIQGKEIEFKMSCLSRLLSYSLSVRAVTFLNFGGVWLTQQSPTSSRGQPPAQSDLHTQPVALVQHQPGGRHS